MLGITFKENCPDVRNTKIVDVITALQDYGIIVDVFDPWASPEEVMHEYQIITTRSLPLQKYAAIVLGVAHSQFLELDLSEVRNEKSLLYDVKGVLKMEVDGKL